MKYYKFYFSKNINDYTIIKAASLSAASIKFKELFPNKQKFGVSIKPKDYKFTTDEKLHIC